MVKEKVVDIRSELNMELHALNGVRVEVTVRVRISRVEYLFLYSLNPQ